MIRWKLACALIFVAFASVLARAADTDSATPADALPFDLGRHACAFDGPVVIAGASVSWGVGASPASLLLEASPGDHQKVMKYAMPGVGSSANIDSVLATDPKTVRTIVAADMFFWDGNKTGNDCNNALQNLRRLTDFATKNNINLILGNLPFTGGPTSCAFRLNQAMQTCDKQPHCYLVDTFSFMQELQKNGTYTVDGRTLTLDDIRPDHLHLSKIGAALFAEKALEGMDEKAPVCTDAAAAVSPIGRASTATVASGKR